MDKIKVGIIGTGFGAKVHAPLMNSHDGFEVVAIASVTRGNLDEAKRVSGVQKVYTDWKQMLENEELDLVVVASAVNLHKEMALQAFRKGMHVLCEKPMSLHTEESMEMISARNDAGKLGLINHEFRFLPDRTKIKEIMNSSKVGKITHIRYQCTYPSYTALTTRPRGWLGQSKAGGGMLGAIGSHMIDTLHWWTNSKLNQVIANLPIHVPTFTDHAGNTEQRTADDAFQVIGSTEDGATVTLELVTAARQTADSYRLEIFGENGTLLMVNDQKVLFAQGDEPFKEVELSVDIAAPKDIPAVAARYYNAYNRMLDALYESISTGNKHPYLADFKNGMDTQKVLDAIRVSAKEGKKIIIHY